MNTAKKSLEFGSSPIETGNVASASALNSQQFINDETNQLQEYLIKFIELVPHLQEINKEEKIKKILYSTQLGQKLNDQQPSASYSQQLDSLQNLDISSKSISDLQILQSVLDYIAYLQNKVHN